MLGAFLFFPGMASAQTFYGTDRSEYITGIVENTPTDWGIISDSFGDCVGTGYGSSRIEIYRWNGSSWDNSGGSISGCTGDQYHGYGWPSSFNPLTNGDGTYAIMYGQGFGTWPDSALQYQIFTVAGGDVIPPATDASCLTGDFGTCINTADPENEQEIATSSLPYTFAVDGYIHADDYEEGARVMIKIDRNTDQQAQGALLAWDSAFGNKTYLDIPDSGTFDVSTSSEAISANLNFPMDRIGMYRARWEVQTPKISILGFSLTYSTIESLNTRFTIGTSTPLDKIQIDQENYLQGVIDSIEGDPLDQCNFNFFDSAFDFRLGSDLLGCIGGMLHWFFVLPPGVLEETIVQLKEGFLTRVPWGYFTRVVTAVQGGAPGTLPTVHADIPISATEDISIEFDIDDMVSGAANLTDTMEAPNGQTARQILEPIIQLIVGLLVLMFIWKDILRSAH